MPESSDLISWPRFVGNARNGRTLSANLTRKAQIVEEQTGVKLSLVQGSPSDSDASAGTHRGPGNAADWATSWSTATDLKVSAAFRALNCLSYVRGQDANGDGLKDDTFDPHIHVIDLDDLGALNDAQMVQRNQYRAGRNALANGAPDREPRPTTVRTLAQHLKSQEGDIIMAITKQQQNDFNALMDGWAKSDAGKAAIQTAVLGGWLGNQYVAGSKTRKYTLGMAIQDTANAVARLTKGVK